MKKLLKPVAFAQKQVVDVQSAAMQSLVISLTFGNDHVSII